LRSEHAETPAITDRTAMARTKLARPDGLVKALSWRRIGFAGAYTDFEMPW
jgi:hypothetical protein